MNFIKINEKDNVVVALDDLKKDVNINVDGIDIKLLHDIKRGHKIAICDIKKNENIIKYGLPIGRAKSDIKIGSHVHVDNVVTNLSDNDTYTYEKVECNLPKLQSEKFLGYKRADGKVGIRNEIWVIPLVGCVNSIAKNIVDECQHLVKGNIDGIYTFTHPYGCSQLGDDHNNTKKLLASLTRHPNAGGVLVLGLGCENLTMSQFKEELGAYDEKRVKFLVAQEVNDEVETAKNIIKDLASYVATFKREEIDVSELIIGMKCGGSDGLSGITANPVVGKFSDMLTSMGGTTILTEVPEMFGAEKILFNKCIDKKVFDKSVKMVSDFKNYFVSHGQTVYENPSPGNKEGGITTLEDKSCGCVQKGGDSYVVDCLNYAECVSTKGLNLLYGPGNDLVSSTALAATGCHIILFTTGRGTPFGSPVPTIKISSNTELYNKKNKWIDFNAGRLVDGESMDVISKDLFDLVIKIASGDKTRQEVNNAREIAIFKDGVTL